MSGEFTLVMERAEWVQHAACRGVDTDLFFTDRGESTKEAKAICAGCPVREECLTFAINNGEHFGVWGGLAEQQRRRLRRKLNAVPEVGCGTRSGYNTHRRRGEDACDECRAASAAYMAKRRGSIQRAS